MSENPQFYAKHLSSGAAIVGGNVVTDGGDFVGWDKIQYIVNSLEDTPLSPEEMHALLAHYRQRLSAETGFVKLEGIPPPDDSLVGVIPLQRVYIRIQALEQRQSQKVQRDEEREFLAADDGRGKDLPRIDLFDLISRLGEYLYRRGETAESSQRPEPVDPLAAVHNHRHLVLLGAPGAGKSTLLRYLAHQTATDDHGKIAILVSFGAFALAYQQDRQLSLYEWALYHAAPDDNELQQALHQATSAGQVLWLCDGLDEAGEIREEVSRQIGQIASTRRRK